MVAATEITMVKALGYALRYSCNRKNKYFVLDHDFYAAIPMEILFYLSLNEGLTLDTGAYLSRPIYLRPQPSRTRIQYRSTIKMEQYQIYANLRPENVL